MSRRTDDWRPAFAGSPPPAGLRGWLTEPGSLTARCQRACQQFRVRLLRQGWAPGLAEPAGPALAGSSPAGRYCRVREVVLECDGVPVIFAHTTLSPAGRSPGRGRLAVWLRRLGSRSLGSLLFAHPGFGRSEIQFCRLDARHPLHRRATALCGPLRGPLWARRSEHRLDGQAVRVTEVFLPAIAALAEPAKKKL